MSRRESKGQQVKTFKHYEPQPDATKIPVIGKVYLEADSGTFVIYLPDHIADALGGLDVTKRSQDANRSHVHQNLKQVRSKELSGAMGLHETVLKEYEENIKNMRGEKVIKVEFAKNLPYRPDRPPAFTGAPVAVGGGFGDTISFTGTPALHLTFKVLWRVNDDLYDKHRTEGWGDRPAYETMRYAGRIEPKSKKVVVIDWTQEREDFLAGIVSKIIELGWLLSDFLGDADRNITHALTTGGGQLSLAPPREEPKGGDA